MAGKVIYDNFKKRWMCSYENSTGKHKRICHGCETEEEALEFLYRISQKDNQFLIKNIAKDMYLPDGDHLKRLEQYGKKLCLKTIKQKRQVIELIVKEYGNVKIDNLDIRRVQQELINDGHSPSWKNQYIETFNAIYDETAWKCDTPVRKPGFRRFIRHSKKADILTEDELDKFLEIRNWDDEKIYLFFKLVSNCGLRMGEARAIKIKQVYRDEHLLLVNGFCKNNGERTNYNKCGNSEETRIRFVPIPEKTLVLIEKYIKLENLGREDYLFTRDGGTTPLRQEYLEKKFKKAVSKSEINPHNRKLVPHSLRYTYVTKMRQVLDIEKVQKIVGHSSPQMTQYYTRFEFSEMAKFAKSAIEAADKIFN